MTGTRARWSAALMVCMIIAACTPRDVTTWIDLHGADSSELPPEVVDVLADFATRITPADWIDLGHGIWGPPILSPIRSCESGARSSANRPYVPSGNYDAQNPDSSASGGFQFIYSTWHSEGHAVRYGVSSAAEAEPWQQDQAALITWQHSGTRPWNESKSCWVNEPIAATCENGVLRDCDQGFAPFSEGAS